MASAIQEWLVAIRANSQGGSSVFDPVATVVSNATIANTSHQHIAMNSPRADKCNTVVDFESLQVPACLDEGWRRLLKNVVETVGFSTIQAFEYTRVA